MIDAKPFVLRDPKTLTKRDWIYGTQLIRKFGSGTFALDSALAWMYLVVAGSLVGFSAYAWLLKVAPISLVVTHQYVNPLVAIALGMAFLGERPSMWTLAGAALIIGAVYVAIRAEFPRKARGARPASVAKRGTPADQTV